jgi:hypothetical protein
VPDDSLALPAIIRHYAAILMTWALAAPAHQGFVKVCVTVRDRQDVRKTAGGQDWDRLTVTACSDF